MNFKFTIQDLNHKRLLPISVDLNRITHMILQLEGLDDIEQEMQAIVLLILDVPLSDTEEKKEALVGTIKEIVQQQFTRANLSLQNVADMLKLSTSYVGRTFKSYEMISLGDYINEIRLEAAMNYLHNRDYTIKEIMEKSGFISESSFFRLFKMKYGMPPKEYRTTKATKI
jgi:AraC-like DNA-binding protein